MERMNPVIYVKVAVILAQGADANDVIADMDYSFIHPDIVETEIRDVEIIED